MLFNDSLISIKHVGYFNVIALILLFSAKYLPDKSLYFLLEY